MFPDNTGQLAGIDSVQADDAGLFQVVIQLSFAAEVGRSIAYLPDNVAFQAGTGAFKVLRNNAVIADQRKGLYDNLAVVTGIGQCFQITGHCGGKYDFSGYAAFCAEALALKYFSVFQNQICGLVHDFDHSFRNRVYIPVRRNDILKRADFSG